MKPVARARTIAGVPLPKGIRQLPSAWLDPVGDDVLPNISA